MSFRIRATMPWGRVDRLLRVASGFAARCTTAGKEVSSETLPETHRISEQCPPQKGRGGSTGCC
jgi:hypothetical protein